jgi:RimJ/RimL family protein N-acetyltransferase
LHDKNLKILHYCIFDKLSDQLIGEVEIRNDSVSGNFGIWINEKFWGKGIMKEAVKLMAQQFFKKYPYLDSFDSQVRPYNTKSLSAHYKTFKEWGQAPNGNFRFMFTKDMLGKMLKNK